MSRDLISVNTVITEVTLKAKALPTLIEDTPYPAGYLDTAQLIAMQIAAIINDVTFALRSNSIRYNGRILNSKEVETLKNDLRILIELYDEVITNVLYA